MKLKHAFIIFCFPATVLASVVEEKEQRLVEARRVQGEVKVDGSLDEEAWEQAVVTTNFTQLQPDEGKAPSQRSEVRLLYDDHAIYVGAYLYDTAPDSILTELTERDNDGANADFFFFYVDPYNKRQDAYVFGVSASGMQVDQRFSDWTYNAVWESHVAITDKGWVVEMKIPYSAIRFPKAEAQVWGIQFERLLKRKQEKSQWSLTPQSQSLPQNFWGETRGISGIEAPIRLSLTPYLSTSWNKIPVTSSDGSIEYANNYTYSAGTDLKYGIDDRFTLDVTLLPDFGQVQSDNKVKNLGYSPVNYEENRSFFKEGTELFGKNNLFYSRRIGQTPSGYGDVDAGEGDEIVSNPRQANLINATKLSGRNDNGLGLGFFNAVTNNTYAVIEDSLGQQRSILTEPLVNYNILVADKQFKNNSNLYVINANVTRAKKFRDANVTGAGLSMFTKKKNFRFGLEASHSRTYGEQDSLGYEVRTQGLKFGMVVEKVSGKIRYGTGAEGWSPGFDATDMGFFSVNNIVKQYAWLYLYRFQPWKFVRNANAQINVTYTSHYQTFKRNSVQINVNLNANLKNLWNVYGGLGITPVKNDDYYEPRVDGWHYSRPPFFWMFSGFSTDQRKKYALSLEGFFGRFLKEYRSNDHDGFGAQMDHRYRVNNKLTVGYNYDYNMDEYSLGYADVLSSDSILFTGRVLETFTNTLGARYALNPATTFSLNMRHYWSTGKYKDFFLLNQDGSLDPIAGRRTGYDFSYNALTIDAVITWWFAPGSTITLVYKKQLEDESGTIPVKYSEDFRLLSKVPQNDFISLKALYWLDYLYLRKKRPRN
ncbi:MAG: carbohydrate binding family 9 domain-containing protein [Flavobacteriales bacterium]|nr:carbohydrate binding family 9 domain-containing protein [Flavobacteriales bacterium]